MLERYLETTQGLFLIKLCSEIDKTVLHIHGSLADKKIVPGVNDERQITNKEKARTIIDNSSIICIFGMSIGATDQAWWQYIAKWLQNDKARRLVIFAKDNGTHEIGKFAARCEKEEQIYVIRFNCQTEITIEYPFISVFAASLFQGDCKV